jgi:hypothetical protein
MLLLPGSLKNDYWLYAKIIDEIRLKTVCSGYVAINFFELLSNPIGEYPIVIILT